MCVGWSTNLQPYPLCKCNKGEALEDREAEDGTPIEHVCKVITDKEQQECYEKSLVFYAKVKRLNPGLNEIKIKDRVKQWSMENNYGITHYGLKPNLFPLSKVVPDGR